MPSIRSKSRSNDATSGRSLELGSRGEVGVHEVEPADACRASREPSSTIGRSRGPTSPSAAGRRPSSAATSARIMTHAGHMRSRLPRSRHRSHDQADPALRRPERNRSSAAVCVRVVRVPPSRATNRLASAQASLGAGRPGVSVGTAAAVDRRSPDVPGLVPRPLGPTHRGSPRSHPSLDVGTTTPRHRRQGPREVEDAPAAARDDHDLVAALDELEVVTRASPRGGPGSPSAP